MKHIIANAFDISQKNNKKQHFTWNNKKNVFGDNSSITSLHINKIIITLQKELNLTSYEILSIKCEVFHYNKFEG